MSLACLSEAISTICFASSCASSSLVLRRTESPPLPADYITARAVTLSYISAVLY